MTEYVVTELGLVLPGESYRTRSSDGRNKNSLENSFSIARELHRAQVRWVVFFPRSCKPLSRVVPMRSSYRARSTQYWPTEVNEPQVMLRGVAVSRVRQAARLKAALLDHGLTASWPSFLDRSWRPLQGTAESGGALHASAGGSARCGNCGS